MYKRSIVILLALLLTACSSWPEYEGYYQSNAKRSNEIHRIYGQNGEYQGHIDSTYRVYDRHGNFIGMIK